MRNTYWKQLFLVSTLTLSPFAAAEGDATTAELVSVPISNAFIAAEGFDDNDNVQVVIEGFLPSSCYNLGQTLHSLNPETGEILLEQRAMKRSQGICGQKGELPPDLAAQRYFWKVLDLGQLKESDYRVTFQNGTVKASKFFKVSSAPTADIDNEDYVLVTNAFANSKISALDAEFEIRITGELTSSCAVLNEESAVQQIGDVFVVLLSARRSEEFCMPASRPFYRVLKVPTPKAGRYLLHVRSLGGQSKNKIFGVQD